jgi:hypothetical protein
MQYYKTAKPGFIFKTLNSCTSCGKREKGVRSNAPYKNTRLCKACNAKAMDIAYQGYGR